MRDGMDVDVERPARATRIAKRQTFFKSMVRIENQSSAFFISTPELNRNHPVHSIVHHPDSHDQSQSRPTSEESQKERVGHVPRPYRKLAGQEQYDCLRVVSRQRLYSFPNAMDWESKEPNGIAPRED
nr:hypothetical protein L204_03456 [Cryptococcus depauperatus CBS 7855]